MITEDKKPENPPAFPNQATINTDYIAEGMTLRDYFANLAMQGMISNNSMYDMITEHSSKSLAFESYMIADAMLKQRKL